MKDKFTLGFIAGLIGAIPMNVINLFNYYVLHLVKIRYLDFSGYMIFGRMPKSTGEAILSQIVQLGFSGVLGAFFAKVLEWISPANSWFKGILWGNGVWFVVYALTVLYRIPVLSTPNLNTAIAQNLTTALWGFTTALILVWLLKKVGIETLEPVSHKYKFIPAPAMKKDHQKVRLVKPKKL